MPNRRNFLKTVAGAAAGVVVGGHSFADAVLGAAQSPAGTRRRAMIGGRRVTVVDEHAHTFVPEVWDLVKDTPLAASARNNLTGAIALLTPATNCPAPSADSTGDPVFNSPWSYVGLPTVSFPVGLSPDGLPLAVQLVGRRWDEPGLLAAAAWCEDVLNVDLGEPTVLR